MKQIIGVTMGDPKGIGPEVLAKAWKELSADEREDFIIYGDRAALDQAALLADVSFEPKHIVVTSSTQETIGQLSDQEAARMTLSALDAAIEDIMNERVTALVTAPVNKARLRSISSDFMGHTEYLAQKADVRDVVMMFFSEGQLLMEACQGIRKPLCVSLVTMHLPLKKVPKAITKDRIATTIQITHEAMQQHFACPDARIAVLSLNPHAGESTTLGTEEQEIIAPVVEWAQHHGINCFGPLAADSLFNHLVDFDYDAVIAMYHDQGLLPIKLLCQGNCTNITLGLPYIRTSPSHGTAEDIAWLGNADHQNMLATLRLTRRLVGWRVENIDEVDEVTGWT